MNKHISNNTANNGIFVILFLTFLVCVILFSDADKKNFSTNRVYNGYQIDTLPKDTIVDGIQYKLKSSYSVEHTDIIYKYEPIRGQH